jgi:hypothetical protein
MIKVYLLSIYNFCFSKKKNHEFVLVIILKVEQNNVIKWEKVAGPVSVHSLALSSCTLAHAGPSLSLL